MTLDEIIDIADKAYGDEGLVKAYHTRWDENHGDTLAKFIAVELTETYDALATEAKQLQEAGRVMWRAADQLTSVGQALEARI